MTDMDKWIQIFIMMIIGAFLLWFGYSLFFGAGGKSRLRIPRGRQKGRGTFPEEYSGSSAGFPKTCPVCSARLSPGERVKSAAFPGLGGKDRMMHIIGCVYCLEGDRARICPVCGSEITRDEILYARLFDKPGRSHVHVLGCSRCRRSGSR